jgi:RND superfamily putative drug exporter
MNSRPRSIFAIATGPRSKWVVFLIWLVGILIAAGPADLPTKFMDAEDNESTSFLPGDAESTKALTATEELQGGELAPAVIVYQRESGLTPADRAKIREDVGRLTAERFPGVAPDGATAAAGGDSGSAGEGPAPEGGEPPAGGSARRTARRPSSPRT